MNRALFITPLVPADARVRGTDIQRRFELLVDGVSRIADAIDFLIFIPGHRADEVEHVQRESERILSEQWQLPTTVTLCPRAMPPAPQSLFTQYFSRALSFFRLPGYAPFAGVLQQRAVTKALAAAPQFVLAQRLQCMVPLLQIRGRVPPVFFDLDDIEHVALARSINQPPQWISKKLEYLYIPALLFGEYRAAHLAKNTFVCSELDRKNLKQLSKLDTFETVPNAVPLGAPSPLTTKHTILLLGLYTHDPNRVAAEYFMNEIWPSIKAQVPDASAVIAGSNPENIHGYTTPPPGISFPGFVDDLNALYADTRVVVCPVRSGAGTRVKIIEAAAHSRPVVSAPIGVEGLNFSDDEDVLLRSDPEAFADACVSLLLDYDQCQRLANAAYARVKQTYERGLIAETIARLIRLSIAAQ